MQFFEVFGQVRLNGALQALFEQVTIEKLSMTSDRKLLRVYILSDRLISKEDIHKVETSIKKQQLSDSMEVVIYEHFNLSAQYNVKTLFSVYQDSIKEELKEKANVFYYLVNNADISFPEDNEIRIVLEDSIISRDKEEEIRDIFDKIINIRCGLDSKIVIDFKESKESHYKEENEHRIDLLVKEITERATGKEENRDEELVDLSVKNPDDISEKNPKTEKKAVKEESEKKDTKKAENAKEDKKERKPLKRSDDPDILYGKEFPEESIPISDITDELGEVVIHGKVTMAEGRSLRNNKYLFTFDITDFTDSISCKIFCWEDQAEEITGVIKAGTFLKVKGIAKFDSFIGEISVGSIFGIRKIKDFTEKRMDHSIRKRVELHCHTKMSDSDGVSYAKDLIKCADSWGMTAMAITDHGVVQAFPEAKHTTDDLNKGREVPFKVLYGVEGYLVDDLKKTVVNSKNQPFTGDFVVFDIETTGLSPVKQKIIEIGAVKVQNGEITDRFSTFVNPGQPIPFHIEHLTGINDTMVANAGSIEDVLPEFLEFCENCILVAHNAEFDMSFILQNAQNQGIETDITYVDTMAISQALLTDQSKHTLDALCKLLGVDPGNHHRAVDDAEATAHIFTIFIKRLAEKEINTLDELNEFTSSSVEKIRRLHPYHVILLAQNEEGRRNLYRMVSESHVKYFNRQPKLPKSVITKYREGIIVGSACEAGELFRALLEEKSDDEIARIVSFYDYLEIQPIGNNMFLLRDEKNKYPNVKTVEDLQNLNKRIVKLGEEWNKPVCATCDVHFMNPEDEVYRRIIMAGKGFEDADNQAPLYLRTTEEMLAEFEYLGSDKAEEVVITNTNLVADMCEYVCPIHPDKCPPVIPNSDETLREICETKAHEMYGENLPPIVRERLDRELNSIISNGFAVMYIIAQKLVWKSNEDGYLVGSRGSVGSSFVATMAGITEVNPLSPHYYCPNCHYSDFDSEEVKAFSGMAGCDMPDRDCPVCGTKLKKDGFDIPFETFLGFKGDKEPDIDLNFSGEYQSKAHKYTEVIFGAGQTFRAGTIGTLAEKTAFGYVKKYFEDKGIKKRTSEINRIVQGCVDVRRTTGQHPGGIIVLPLGYDINQFTPVQHPANDMTTDIITTHFDYHSIDHNLLKLDILGHDDPTMIRMLQDLTGIDPLQIPLDDKGVMSLFQDTSALGITPDQIEGCKLGTLGVPEFGTDFAMQMLIDAKPKAFSDLVRISGLSHGTNVWLGNAQELIEKGLATISTAICTRDDIMVYLIHMGLEAGMAFSIMENVRKGKVAKKKCDKWEEWKEEMKAHNVPDWYIWSCEKIEYMFPKAHAAAYVMMAWRIAYCKVNYPLAYYAAFFTIRAKAFDYSTMCLGREVLDAELKRLRNKEDLLQKDEDTIRDMRIVQEMYARGFEFMPIDIFRAHSKNFQIIDGKIMPSLTSIPGLADAAGEAIMEAVKKGPFTSRDDFKERTKVPQTVVDKMNELGLLGSLPESNQIKIFDLMG